LTWEEVKAIKYLTSDWNRLARDGFGVELTTEKQEILHLIQHNRKISLRSGHAWGKDYMAALSANCYLYSHYPAIVICTAPTHRQAISINMAEISSIHRNSKIPLTGEVLTNIIKFPYKGNKNKPDTKHYLMAFKAGDKSIESWTGFHSPNLFLIMTEASGIEDAVDEATEGILTGVDPKKLILFNPNNNSGFAYKSVASKFYVSRKLSCLDAANVVNKNNDIPGQVDYPWVKEHVEMWCRQIEKDEVSEAKCDFEFDGKWWRPNNLARVKILGEFPEEDESQVIPMRWVELANERWLEGIGKFDRDAKGCAPLSLGVDVAGMGRDKTVPTFRYGSFVEKIEEWDLPVDDPAKIHMAIAGKIKQTLRSGDKDFVDSLGEGAGVHARLLEMEVDSVSVKFSESAKGYTDLTGERTFANMRSLCIWAVRDALDPKLEGALALPPDAELMQELCETRVKNLRSDGSIVLEPKDEIKKRIGRSPDKSDSLAISFYPGDTDAIFFVGGGER